MNIAKRLTKNCREYLITFVKIFVVSCVVVAGVSPES